MNDYEWDMAVDYPPEQQEMEAYEEWAQQLEEGFSD